MITAQELMIGNITSKGFVMGITARGINVGPFGVDFYKYHEVEPIELNKYWLEKLGFKPFGNDWYKDGIIVHTRKRGFVINKRTPIMKTVHQLQNYCFTNKGKKLYPK